MEQKTAGLPGAGAPVDFGWRKVSIVYCLQFLYMPFPAVNSHETHR
jgi:hypothetical protein